MHMQPFVLTVPVYFSCILLAGTRVPVSRHGCFLCCRQCPTTLSHQPPQGYRMQYSITYRDIQPQEHIERVEMITLNVVDVGWWVPC